MPSLKHEPLWGGEGMIEYLAILIIGLENPVHDPNNPNQTTENCSDWIKRMLLFNSGLLPYSQRGKTIKGLGDFVENFKTLYPHFFNQSPFFIYWNPNESLELKS